MFEKVPDLIEKIAKTRMKQEAEPV